MMIPNGWFVLQQPKYKTPSVFDLHERGRVLYRLVAGELYPDYRARGGEDVEDGLIRKIQLFSRIYNLFDMIMCAATSVESGFEHWLLKFDGMGADSELGGSQDYGRIEYAYSLMAKLKGFIPSRDEDELGIGIAGLKGSVGPDNDGTEFHTEVYYRIVLTKNFAVSPDIQYVANPLGNSHNDGVFAGMLRLEFSF